MALVPPHYYDADFEPNPMLRLFDMPDGRTRVIENVGYAADDFRQLRPFLVPLILDLAERRVVLDMSGRRADITTAWEEDVLSLRDGWAKFVLAIDVGGARFREASAPDAPWQPLDRLQTWIEARVPTLDEAFPPTDPGSFDERPMRRFSVGGKLAGLLLLAAMLYLTLA